MSGRARRAARRDRDDALDVFLRCIATGAIVACFVPGLLTGALGKLFLTAAVLSGFFAILFHVRQGGSIVGALLRLVWIGSIGAGTIIGVWWYFTVYLAAQPHLFNFGSLGQQPPLSIHSAASITNPVSATSQPVIPIVTVVPQVQAAPSACGEAVVKGTTALSIRAAPTRQSQRLGVVPEGHTVMLVCSPEVTADGLRWYRVSSGTVDGWMSARYLTILGE